MQRVEYRAVGTVGVETGGEEMEEAVAAAALGMVAKAELRVGGRRPGY